VARFDYSQEPPNNQETAMPRYMIIVKATKESESGVRPADALFAEMKELIAGYTIIRTRSREEAIEWTRRFPNPSIDAGRAQIEVRRLKELEDFGDSPVLDRFKEIELSK
jgi:hypothetical protein